MGLNEIKKSLYRNKQVAILNVISKSGLLYQCHFTDTLIIFFKVPFDDIGDAKFNAEMPAHLLLRWLKTDISLSVKK